MKNLIFSPPFGINKISKFSIDILIAHLQIILEQIELCFYVECNSEAITFHILGDQRFETDFRILCDIYTGLQLPECNKYLWKSRIVHIIENTMVLE